MQNFLRNEGVEEIKTIGEKFDPNFHEVVEEIKGEKSGFITEEIQKGYMFNNKLLRASKVKIIK